MYPRTDDDGAMLRVKAGLPRTRCRSFCFLEQEDERWTVFLVTYPREDGQWRGYFSFRSASLDPQDEELRTADLFVETSEAAVDSRARSLGRPLLEALLQSAVHTFHRRRGVRADYGRWFRELLSRHSARLESSRGALDEAIRYDQLRSLYESYRTDQVSHLIALIEPAAFRELVEQLLEGREIDFGARDRFQLAMIVVQELERLLPIPPFEIWAEDYLAHTAEHQRYSHALHHGELP